jgi:Kae1-associated kinase Bud32
MKIIQHGAEAVILLDKDKIIKRRVPKSYRIKELDEKIRSRRTKSEVKLLEKASKIISVPNILDNKYFRRGGWVGKSQTYQILMPFIKGKKLSEHLDNFPLKKQKEICKKIGENVARLHDEDIIHGDLTTSNMICDSVSLHTLRPKVYFIDFGLGFISHKIEDKAVDLHLLRQALEAKHFKNWRKLFNEILKSYASSENSKKVLQQFEKVESRGRYKDKY